MNALLRDLELLLLLTALCSAAEFLWAPRRPSPANILFNFACGLLALPTLHGLHAVASPFWIWLRTWAIFPIDLDRWDPEMKWVLAFAALFAWDLLQYWAHRAQHRFPWLWRFHRLHHSDLNVSGATSSRIHLLSHLANIACIAIPMALLFPESPLSAWCAFLFFHCYGYFNHTILPIELGPLTSVISGPKFHRVHHGIAVVHHDKNFAAFFPILDIVFGTYYEPAKNEQVETGIHGCDAPNSLANATIEPLVSLLTDKVPKSRASRKRAA